MGISITGEALQELLEAKKIYRTELYIELSNHELSGSYFDVNKRNQIRLPLSEAIKSRIPPKAQVLGIDVQNDELDPIIVYYTIPDPPEIRLPKREADRETIGEEAGP